MPEEGTARHAASAQHGECRTALPGGPYLKLHVLQELLHALVGLVIGEGHAAAGRGRRSELVRAMCVGVRCGKLLHESAAE